MVGAAGADAQHPPHTGPWPGPPLPHPNPHPHAPCERAMQDVGTDNPRLGVYPLRPNTAWHQGPKRATPQELQPCSSRHALADPTVCRSTPTAPPRSSAPPIATRTTGPCAARRRSGRGGGVCTASRPCGAATCCRAACTCGTACWRRGRWGPRRSTASCTPPFWLTGEAGRPRCGLCAGE